MSLIDTHTHLLSHRYEDAPVTDRIGRAGAAGVAHHINIACHPSEWAPALALASEYPAQVSASLGIHPHDAAAQPLGPTMIELENLLSNPSVVALGETGLDYYYNKSPKPEQHASFHAHLSLCKKHNLPAVIHTRDAEEDTLAILAEHPGTPFVIHCFSGTQKLADESLVLGGYISLSGILTFKKSEDIRTIARTLPHNKILLETDAPYLAPEPFRSKLNESGLMVHTAKVLANLLGKTEDEIAHLTTQNARRLFTRLPSFFLSYGIMANNLKALQQQKQLIKEQRKSNDMIRQQNRLIGQQNKLLGQAGAASEPVQGGGNDTFMGSLGKLAGAVGGALGETFAELKEDFRTSNGGILSDHARYEINKGQMGIQSQEGAHNTGGSMEESFVRTGPTNPLVATPVWQHLMNPGKPKVQLDCYAHATSPESLKAYLTQLKTEDAYPFTATIGTINLGGSAADKQLLEDFSRALATQPNLYGSIGYGPRNLVEDVDAMDEQLTSLLNSHPKLLAIGPVGLDAPFASHTIPQQMAQLARQMEIAADFGLPVFLRNIGATAELKQVMAGLSTKPRAIIYTRPFTTTEEKELILAHDMYILLRSEATWPDHATYRQNIFNIPKLRWLLASGNGLTASERNKGGFNTSASLPDILTTLADAGKQDTDTLLGNLNANAYRLFYHE